MNNHPIRRFLFAMGVIVFIYLVAYCAFIKRVVVRTPSYTTATGETRAQLIPLPTFRGFGVGQARIIGHIFGPALEVDRHFVRRAYWETKVEIEKSQETQP